MSDRISKNSNEKNSGTSKTNNIKQDSDNIDVLLRNLKPLSEEDYEAIKRASFCNDQEPIPQVNIQIIE